MDPSEPEIYLPDAEKFAPAAALEQALAATTHLGVAAHPDDLEIMAIDGILKGFSVNGNLFSGVVLTAGSGAPRAGMYSALSDAELAALRKEEQKEAARIGRYGALLFLNFNSQDVKQGSSVVESLAQVLRAARPRFVYTHNLLDAHPTHSAAGWRVIQALRSLPEGLLPEQVYGCEVWRGLDWLPARWRVAFDCSEHLELQKELLQVFKTQVESGKRYDRAIPGRRAANAGMREPNSVDKARALVFALDLNPLMRDKTLSPRAYLREILKDFEQEALSTLPEDA
ncbi:MAG: PIG-L family deacetylase [Anaerolineaceae bacterium]